MQSSITSLSLVLSCLVGTGVFATDKESTPPAPSQKAAPGKPSGKRFTDIDVKVFEQLREQKTNIVLDVRTPKEFTAGHIPGAINMDVNGADFATQIAALDKNRTYLVHCRSGVRSIKACEKLFELNITNLFNLEGGIKSWEKAGLKPQQ